jgi:4-hydroxybenzoyl-CoA thioesterase
MGFVLRQKVLFKHCDPAGIVFYPRYFEMVNDCVEAFFDDALGYAFQSMHGVAGVPTARIEARFSRPSRHGDVLDIALSCVRIGRTSLDLAFTARCGPETRFQASATLVHVDGAGRPQGWPVAVRAGLAKHLEKGG